MTSTGAVDAAQIVIDEEFRAICPALTGEEISKLRDSIRQYGCMDAVKVWPHGKKLVIVDGYHRWQICEELGVDYETYQIDLEARADVIDWIIDNQLGRRNLTPDAFKLLLGRRYNRAKKQGARTDLTSAQHEQRSTTAEALGVKHGVSRETVKRAGKFAEECEADSEVKEAVMAGKPRPKPKTKPKSEKEKAKARKARRLQKEELPEMPNGEFRNAWKAMYAAVENQKHDKWSNIPQKTAVYFNEVMVNITDAGGRIEEPKKKTSKYSPTEKHVPLPDGPVGESWKIFNSAVFAESKNNWANIDTETIRHYTQKTLNILGDSYQPEPEKKKPRAKRREIPDEYKDLPDGPLKEAWEALEREVFNEMHEDWPSASAATVRSHVKRTLAMTDEAVKQSPADSFYFALLSLKQALVTAEAAKWQGVDRKTTLAKLQKILDGISEDGERVDWLKAMEKNLTRLDEESKPKSKPKAEKDNPPGAENPAADDKGELITHDQNLQASKAIAKKATRKRARNDRRSTKPIVKKGSGRSRKAKAARAKAKKATKKI